jgi:UDP-N-acetylmuramoyl-tripeptide--D-alanyl-D-alanine ligase
MIEFSLAQIAAGVGGRLAGRDAQFRQVSTDSRSLPAGALFVALRGERFDGHEFVAAAAGRGAVAAVVEFELAVDCPQVVVADSHLALGRIGAMWRDAAVARVVALTGSNGKTTVKEMIAAIVAQRGPVLATCGNLNNDIGVPITLSRLQDEEFAVVEMGANHRGEIDYLSRLVRPDVAVLNNAGRAHLEGFGSLEEVARAKAEIVNGLAANGTFVCPGDSPWTPMWRELAGDRTVITFATDPAADVTAPPGDALTWTDTGFRQEFPVTVPGGEIRVQLALAGHHNRRNALAAVAAACALGIDLEAIAVGLATLSPVAGRLCPVAARDGIRLIDDSYNANPDSVDAAMEVLVTAPGRRVLVLGDLAELGAESEALHAEIGVRAGEYEIDLLFTLGNASRLAAETFGTGAAHFAALPELLEHLAKVLRAGDTVLVKGSRSARMERVVTALRSEREKVAC